MLRAARTLALVALLAACAEEAAAPAESGSPSPPPAAGVLSAPPDVVLITLDTLRRDHLGCYGYFRDTTPRIDALAAEGLVFERALAPMASTLPSHLTMLTGLYPHQHGMRSNRRGASVPFTSELGRLSVAAVLRDAGYRTAAFVSAPPVGETTGIQAGFATFDSAPYTQDARRAAETNERVLAWLEAETATPGPIFLWVHYFDPHEPNDPSGTFERLYATDERQLGWIRERGIDPAALTARFGASNRVHRHFLAPDRVRRGQPVEHVDITLEHVADMMNRYDGELRYMDDQVGALLDALRRHGRYDGSIVVLVADHGQSLGEDDWLGHGTITDVNTFVPWILRLPPAIAPPPQRIGALVSLADLLPTVLARFPLPGTELLVGQLEGQDVLSGAFARDFALAERTHDELSDGETGLQYAVHSGRWRLIHRPGGADELYDASSGDPRDVAAEHPEVLERLRAETRALLARRSALLPDPAPGSADEELLESLKELGYGGD